MRQLFLFLAAAALAAPADLPPLKFTDTRLPNGLRVLLMEDHYAPVYSIAVAYNVGSRDERKGRTGFAHLFEHMMFKGSEKVGPGEHFYLIFNNGGNMNGTTNTDRTVYYETLPKNQLDMGLFLEADRMRSLVITPDNLENQREAVKEERRLALDNQPYGRTYDTIAELLYDNFAYKHSVIGSMEDLSAATVGDVKEFFGTYYAPNNAVLSLVGDFDSKDVLQRIRRYFGDIPRQAPPKPVDMTEPAREGERRAKLDDKLARLARIDMAWQGPPGNSADAYALRAMTTVLGGGESSRLYQKLVKEKEAATAVTAYLDERRGPSTLVVAAMVRPGKTPEEVEALIGEEIARIQAEPVTAKELARSRSSARRRAIATRESSLYRAVRLADDAVNYNDPASINTSLYKQLAVSAADVQRVARGYLKKDARVVVYSLPAAGGRR